MTPSSVTKRILEVDVHRTADGYWAEVRDHPGCLATGENLSALLSNLHEALSLYITDDDATEAARILTRLTSLSIELEYDARPAEADNITQPTRRRKRQPHREDWRTNREG